MEQEAVQTPAEETAPIESAPVEIETTDAQSTPVEESSQPENKVSESVPYERFKEVNSKLSDPEFIAKKAMEMGLMGQPAEYTPVETTGEDYFDETTTNGVMALAKQAVREELIAEQTKQWIKAHADDLRDRAVDALTKDLIRQGVDRDEALSEAKKELEGRKTSVRKEALTEGVQEGQQLANKKAQMGAIGTSGSSDKVDLSTLSAEEYAKYMGLQRVE